MGVGAIISAPSFMRVLLNMKMGKLADEKGRKPLMVLGTLASAAGGIGTAFAGGLLTLLPFRLLVGMGSAASMAGSSAYMADLTSRAIEHRAKLLGVQQAVIACSFIAGPAIGGWLAELYDARTAFIVVGAAAAACSLGYSFLPETLVVKKPKKGADAEKEEKEAKRKTWGQLLKNKSQQSIVTMQATLAMGYSCQLAVVPMHAADVWGATPGQLGLMFSTASLMGLVAAPLGGWAADKFGRKGVIVPAALLSALAPATLAFIHTQEAFYGAMLCWSLGTSMLNPGLTAFAADIAPDSQRGQALSLSRQAGDVMFTAGPIGLGALAQYAPHGHEGALLLTTGATLAVTAAFMARAKEPERKIPGYAVKA